MLAVDLVLSMATRRYHGGCADGYQGNGDVSDDAGDDISNTYESGLCADVNGRSGGL